MPQMTLNHFLQCKFKQVNLLVGLNQPLQGLAEGFELSGRKLSQAWDGQINQWELGASIHGPDVWEQAPHLLNQGCMPVLLQSAHLFPAPILLLGEQESKNHGLGPERIV